MLKTAALSVKKYLGDNRFYLLFPVIFALFSLVLIIFNGSLIFQYDFLNRYGDQHHYYDLAYNLAHGDFPKSLYTLGYSLFYLPFILVTGAKENWTSIMNLLIPVQAFVLVPATIFLIFKNKAKKFALVTLGLMVLYYLLWLLPSDDVLIKYNFLGLMPLSEPLAIFCLIGAYWVYLKYFFHRQAGLKHLTALALLIGGGVLTRNTMAILYLPLFIDMMFDKHWRRLVNLGALSLVFYSPQLVYNYLCSHHPFFNGYAWWADNHVAKNTQSIQKLYGINSHAMFGVHYLLVNIKALLLNYLPLVLLGAINYVRRHRLVLLILGASLLNLIFHLAYWWSKTGGLIDRFLLPNVLLLLFIFKNRMIEEAPHEPKS